MKKFQGSNTPRPRMKNVIPTKQPLLTDMGRDGSHNPMSTIRKWSPPQIAPDRTE